MPATDALPLDTGVLDAFTHTLRTLSAEDIRRHATQLRMIRDDVDWWRTTIDVEHRLRDAHLSRRAAAAARAARDAVLATATRDGGGVGVDLLAVARAASDTARALVAGFRIADANSFAVRCEPLAPPHPSPATSHPTAA